MVLLKQQKNNQHIDVSENKPAASDAQCTESSVWQMPNLLFQGTLVQAEPAEDRCVQLRQHRSPPTCNIAFVKPNKALLLSLPGITASGQPARTPGRPGESCPRSEQPLAGVTQQQKPLLVRNANYRYKSAWQFFIEHSACHWQFSCGVKFTVIS